MHNRYHFYLSYPHPTRGSRPPAGPDPQVGAFFEKLCAAVDRHGSAMSGVGSGFLGRVHHEDWKTGLESAEVFVPLYSPRYFSRAQTGRELVAFRRRMARAGIPHPDDRIVPVLWSPPSYGRHRPWVDDSLTLEGLPDSYRQNGMQALARLWMYEHDYQTIIDLLAARITTISRAEPVGPSAIDGPDELDRLVTLEPADVTLIIAADQRVAADWRPFGDEHEPALHWHAQRLAEQFDLTISTNVLDARTDLHHRPGVLLIDPRYMVHGEGRALLGLMTDLPPWVVPLLLALRGAPHAEEFCAEVGWAPAATRRPSAEPGHREAHTVDSLHRFVDLMPFLMAEAERRYLRHGPPSEMPGAKEETDA